MAEPFKQTPASRVFGFGLRPQQPAPTFFGTPILADRNRLSPFLRQNAFQEQAMAAQEDALAAQQQEMQARQQELMRHQQVLEAEDAAMQDLAAGEQLGNIFKKNPALAFSRNAGQLASAAQMIQPSNAMKAAIPSLAMKLPIEERTIFNQLLSDPEFSTNPFAAYDEAQRRSARARQHGELVKAGVPLSKIDTTRDYAPIEYEDLVRQHTQPKTGNDYLDKLVQQTWTDFDDQYDPPETLTDPMDIALDKAEKKARLREGILAKYGAVKPIAPADAATAQNITAPGAMGGAPSFKQTMQGQAGKVPKATDILQVSDDEIIQDINSPEADENTFMFALQDPATSEKVKREALNRLKAFAKEPKFPKGTGPAEARTRIAALQNKVAEGERQLRKLPEQRKINEAWTAEKSDMDRYITEYAKSLGLDPDIVAVGIAQKEPLEKGFNEKGQRDNYRDDFARFLSKKMGVKGDPLSKQSDRLFPFQGSEFAEDFGLAGNIPGFRSIGKGKTYGEVLDTVLAEKFGGNLPSQSGSQEAVVEISTKEEVDALPKGAKFRGPDGKIRIK